MADREGAGRGGAAQAGADRPRRGDLAAAVVAVFALGLALRAWLAATSGLHLDEEWHVLTAVHDDMALLERELRGHAHPPLYFALARGVLAVFAPPLALRVLSIACGLATIAVVGATLRRLAITRGVALVAMLAMAASYRFALLSIEIRQYPLLILLQAIALHAAVGLAQLDTGPRARPGVVLWLALVAASLAHYAGALVAAATVALPFALAAVSPPFRRAARARITARGLAVGAAALATGALALGVWIRAFPETLRRGERLPWVESHLLGPDESIAGFLLRNTGRELEMLWMPGLPSDRPWLVVAVVVLLVVAIAAALWRRLRDLRDAGEGDLARSVRTWLPTLIFVATLAPVVALSLLGRYPYGGSFRHQSIVWLPGVILAAWLLDRALAGREPRVRRRALALAGAAVLAVGAAQLAVSSRERGEHEALVRAMAARPIAGELVYASTGAFLALAALHRGEPPRSLAFVDDGRVVVGWPAEAGDDAQRIVRDERFSDLPIQDAAFWAELGALVDALGARSVVLIDVPRQAVPEAAVRSAATRAGVDLQPLAMPAPRALQIRMTRPDGFGADRPGHP